MPSRTISRYLADMAAGLDVLELSTAVKGEARFFLFEVRSDDAGRAGEIELPQGARIVCFYRDGAFHLADDDSRLHAGDEAVILTDSKNLAQLRERWQPRAAAEVNGAPASTAAR